MKVRYRLTYAVSSPLAGERGYAFFLRAARGQCATACEKHSVHLSAGQMANRIVKRSPIVVQAHVVRISGSVELMVEVDADGKPSCISAVRGHPILTSAAVANVKDWRFRPYRSEGECLRACFDENEPAGFNSPQALSLVQRAAKF